MNLSLIWSLMMVVFISRGPLVSAAILSLLLSKTLSPQLVWWSGEPLYTTADHTSSDLRDDSIVQDILQAFSSRIKLSYTRQGIIGMSLAGFHTSLASQLPDLYWQAKEVSGIPTSTAYEFACYTGSIIAIVDRYAIGYHMGHVCLHAHSYHILYPFYR